MALLDGLDRANWRLHHAYGPDDDVPDLLRALVDPASASATIQNKARAAKKPVFEWVCWTLWGNVIHQGSVWPVPSASSSHAARCGFPPSASRMCSRRQLLRANPMVSLSITETMIRLVFGDAGAPSTAHSLTRVQARALHAIADHGAFAVGDGTFANCSLLLSQFGLPSARRELRAWLAG